MEDKNIQFKISNPLWKSITKAGHSCRKLALNFLIDYAKNNCNYKETNSLLENESKPKENKTIPQADETFEDEFENDWDEENSVEVKPLTEGSELPVNHTTNYKEQHETFDEKIERIAKEQKDEIGHKLTKKEKERLEQEELGKKFGKDPNKYTFETVTPESLAKDGWTKEQIDAYMKSR
jgi:hypothetical protein